MSTPKEIDLESSSTSEEERPVNAENSLYGFFALLCSLSDLAENIAVVYYYESVYSSLQLFGIILAIEFGKSLSYLFPTSIAKGFRVVIEIAQAIVYSFLSGYNSDAIIVFALLAAFQCLGDIVAVVDKTPVNSALKVLAMVITQWVSILFIILLTQSSRHSPFQTKSYEMVISSLIWAVSSCFDDWDTPDQLIDWFNSDGKTVLTTVPTALRIKFNLAYLIFCFYSVYTYVIAVMYYVQGPVGSFDYYYFSVLVFLPAACCGCPLCLACCAGCIVVCSDCCRAVGLLSGGRSTTNGKE